MAYCVMKRRFVLPPPLVADSDARGPFGAHHIVAVELSRPLPEVLSTEHCCDGEGGTRCIKELFHILMQKLHHGILRDEALFCLTTATGGRFGHVTPLVPITLRRWR